MDLTPLVNEIADAVIERLDRRNTVTRATYTTGEAGQVLGLSGDYVRRLCRDGQLAHIPTEISGTKKYLIPKTVIDEILASASTSPAHIAPPVRDAGDVDGATGRPVGAVTAAT